MYMYLSIYIKLEAYIQLMVNFWLPRDNLELNTAKSFQLILFCSSLFLNFASAQKHFQNFDLF